MKKFLILIPTLFFFNMGVSGCSDSVGPECTPTTVELKTTFVKVEDDYEEIGSTLIDVIASGGRCKLENIHGYLQFGYPFQDRTYSCVICREEY